MTNVTVLLVDDSRVSRMMIAAIIRTSHPAWTITEAANADEALGLLQGSKPTLAIIDFNMPGIDGIELSKKVRELSPATRITLLTANVQDSLRDKTRALQIGFVGKPITEEKINSIISDI